MLSSNRQIELSSTRVVGVLGMTSQIRELLDPLANENLQFLEITDELLESNALISCDAVVGILDGNVGISAAFIDAWHVAADHDIDRIVLAVNTVTGRADFDEALALAELVLSEDVVIRYYPIVSDDEPEDQYVGLLDVLLHEIRQPNQLPIKADREHVDLTADDHDELVESLVHNDLNSEILSNHNAGLPISLPRLTQIWSNFDFVTVLPFDNQVSDEIFVEWLSVVKNRWLPIYTFQDRSGYVKDQDIPLGLGVGHGVARVWNLPTDLSMELHTDLNETLALAPSELTRHLLIDQRVRSGDVIRPLDSQYQVNAPSD